MTPEQKTIVQETWTQIAPIAGKAAQLFYGRLFEIDPTTRPLFRFVNMPMQHDKLMGTLGTAVGSLDNLEALLPVVEAMGRRHVAYGVKDSHYDSVGAALLWTLEQGLGAAWTAEAADAWGTVYAAISAVMRGAAKVEESKVA
ncbi:MAG: hemin receptor [Alphaproteobacteria bacterium]|nr:hemin receptor [Alphaproteobacteria bacterium]